MKDHVPKEWFNKVKDAFRENIGGAVFIPLIKTSATKSYREGFMKGWKNALERTWIDVSRVMYDLEIHINNLYGEISMTAHKANTLVKNGVVEQPKADFHTYCAYINKCNQVVIPSQMRRELGLVHGSLLQVAIRMITVEEAKDKFLDLPPHKVRMTQ